MAAYENAHGVLDRGRKGTTDQESELSRTHGTNDAAGHAAATPSFEAAAEYRRVRLDLIPLRRRDKMPADRRWQEPPHLGVRVQDALAALGRGGALDERLGDLRLHAGSVG